MYLCVFVCVAHCSPRHEAILKEWVGIFGTEFIVETSRINLLALGLDSLAASLRRLEEVDWEAHARLRPSIFAHRVRLFGAVLAQPFIDVYRLARQVGSWVRKAGALFLCAPASVPKEAASWVKAYALAL